MFAALEIDYSESDADPTGEAFRALDKELVYYELDLGLNHVVRKWSDTTDPTANLLITVPGGGDGPGGVLICCENYIIYKNQGTPECKAPIPRRAGSDTSRTLLIVSFATHKQKVFQRYVLYSSPLYMVPLRSFLFYGGLRCRLCCVILCACFRMLEIPLLLLLYSHRECMMLLS